MNRGEKTGRTNEFLEGLLEHRSNVPALRVSSSETLGPADKLAVINAFLPVGRKQIDLYALS